SGVGLDSW
nr:immunoglobulin heavy chain junction region [Macaca mulatta]